MTYYLAGPMTGHPDQNYPAFEAACVRIRHLGFSVLSPHETMPHPTHADDARWRELLRWDLGTLLSCQGIILLPGWSTSKGATFELHIAVTLGMKICSYQDDHVIDIG